MASQLAKDIVAAALEEDMLSLKESVDQALTERARELVENRKADFGSMVFAEEDDREPEDEDEFDDEWFEDDDEDLEESADDESSELSDEEVEYLASLSDEELNDVMEEAGLDDEQKEQLVAALSQDDAEEQDDSETEE